MTVGPMNPTQNTIMLPLKLTPMISPRPQPQSTKRLRPPVFSVSSVGLDFHSITANPFMTLMMLPVTSPVTWESPNVAVLGLKPRYSKRECCVLCSSPLMNA